MQEGAKKRRRKVKNEKPVIQAKPYFFIVRNPCIHSARYEYRYFFI